jgi:predicted metal-dependent phosphoesterase TrpH
VTVLAPSSRTSDLARGRRAIQAGSLGEVVAVAPAISVSSRGALQLPVGVRARLRAALQIGGFDVVHAVEPGIPGLSNLALLDAETTTLADFGTGDRLGYPTRQNHRDRLLARIDVLAAQSAEAAERAAERFPGHYAVVPPGVDLDLFAADSKRDHVVVETAAASVGVVRAVLRAARELPTWEVTVLRTTRGAMRPTIPAALRGRAHVRTATTEEARARILGDAAILVPAIGGSPRLRVEGAAAACALVEPPGLAEQPELAAAALLRLAEDPDARRRAGDDARSRIRGFDDVALELESLYERARARRRPVRRHADDPLADRDWIVADLHMHTSWSHDCSIEVDQLLDHADAEGLGAIAVTDHNVLGGALEAVERARGRDLIVVPGEEVKTDGQGEVIGLFLEEEIPRGMPFAETIAAIREQDGIVYLPHPFDRMHAIPSPATLHRHLAEIDVLEVYNARLLFESYNDEAVRFARKYGLLAGAGSDAHVLPGVGTGALRMRRFEGPEEFLLSLRTAEVLRRPKSLAYLQSLKWVAQVKERAR